MINWANQNRKGVAFSVFLSIVLQVFVPAYINPFNAYAEEEMVYKDIRNVATIDTSASAVVNKPDIFKAITLGAVKYVDTVGVAKLQFEVWLDSDVVGDIWESCSPDHFEDDPNDITSWSSLTWLPEITFSTLIDGKDLGLEGSTETALHLIDLGGEVVIEDEDNSTTITVGAYTLALEGGDIRLTCTLRNQVYAYANAEFSIGFQIGISNDFAIKSKLSFSDGSGDAVILNIKQVGTDPEDNYTVEMTAPAIVNQNEIMYTLTATAIRTAVLSGRAIYFPIPSQLQVVGVSVSTDGGLTTVPALFSSTGAFVYEFPEGLAKEAIFQITTRMSSVEYQAYMGYSYFGTGRNNGQVYPLYGSMYNGNRVGMVPIGHTGAQILASTGGVVFQATQPAETSMQIQEFFRKTRKKSADSKSVRWTVNVEGRLADAQNAYLVDTIVNTESHVYASGQAVSITANDGSTNGSISMIGVSATTSASLLTVADLNALTDNGQNAVYYTYNGTKSALIVPLPEEYLMTPSKVEYYTDVVIPGIDDEVKTKTLENDVYLRAQGLNYEGILYTNPGYINAAAYINADFSFVAKDFISYTKETQTARWRFEVNRFGTTMSSIVIEEYYKDNFMALDPVLADERGTISAIWYNKEDSEATNPSKNFVIGGNSSDTNYYEVDDTNGILRIHIGLEVGAGDAYRFFINTKVENGSLLASQGALNYSLVGRQYNKASIAAVVVRDEQGTTGEAVQPTSTWFDLHNYLITKTSLGAIDGSYDFETKSIPWKITVNPFYIPISEAAITDTLPLGTTFGGIKSVIRTKYGTPSTTESGVINSDGTVTFVDGLKITLASIYDTDGDGYTKNKQSFGFDAQIKDKFEIVYTTVYEENFRREQFKEGVTITAINPSVLEGNIFGVRTSTTGNRAATDQSSVAFVAPPMDKYGIYTEGPYTMGDITEDKALYVTWKVLFNRNQVSMAGVTLTDILKPQFEMDPDSLKIYTATVGGVYKNTTAQGIMFTTIDAITTQDAIASMNGIIAPTGFALTIPDEYAQETLYLEFVTLLLDNIDKKEDMTNVLTLSNGLTTAAFTVVGAKIIDLEDYAKGSTSPNARIYVTSKNTTYTFNSSLGIPMPDLRLTGVAVRLIPMNGPADNAVPSAPAVNASKTWYGNVALEKNKFSSASKGLTNFMYLKLGVLYRIEQTATVPGYRKPVAQYVIFSKNTLTADDYPVGTRILPYPLPTSLTGIQDTRVFILENDPGTGEEGQGSTTGEVSFYKLTEDGKPISGAGFTLSGKNLTTKSTLSDGNGLVKFSNVDIGSYNLTETTIASIFRKPTGTMGAIVSYNTGNQDFEFKITTSGGTKYKLSTETSGSGVVYKLKNDFKRGDIQLTTKATGITPNISGSGFAVYASESGILVGFLTESGISGTYKLSISDGQTTLGIPATSQAIYGTPYMISSGSGFALLEGDYYAVMTKIPNGYLAPTGPGGSHYKYSFNITDYTVKAVTTTLTWSQGIIAGTAVWNDGSIVGAGVTVGIFPVGTTTFVPANLYTWPVNTTGSVLESATSIAITDANSGFSFTSLPAVGKADFVVAEIDYGMHKVKASATQAAIISPTAIKANVVITNAGLYGLVEVALQSKAPNGSGQLVSGAGFALYTTIGGARALIGYISEKGTTGKYSLITNTGITTKTSTSGLDFIAMDAKNQSRILEGDYFIELITKPALYMETFANIGEAEANTKRIYPLIGVSDTISATIRVVSADAIWAQGKFSGMAVKSNGKPLENVKIALFPIGTTDFSESNVFKSTGSSFVSEMYPSNKAIFVTTTNGQFSFDGLPAGQYMIAQIDQSHGYYATTEPMVAEITDAGITIKNTSGGLLKFMSTVPYGFTELDLRADYEPDGLAVLLPGATFEVYISGGALHGQKVAYLIEKSGQAGRYELSASLGALTTTSSIVTSAAFGGRPYLQWDDDRLKLLNQTATQGYYIVQMQNPIGYMENLSGAALSNHITPHAIRPFHIEDEEGNDARIVTLTALWAQGKISGHKVDVKGNGLGGAKLGLFGEDVTSFTTSNLYKGPDARASQYTSSSVAISSSSSGKDGGDGSYSFTGLPLGRYQVREIETPSAEYKLNPTPMSIEILGEGTTLVAPITDAGVRSAILLDLVDETSLEKLTGGAFVVYATMGAVRQQRSTTPAKVAVAYLVESSTSGTYTLTTGGVSAAGMLTATNHLGVSYLTTNAITGELELLDGMYDAVQIQIPEGYLAYSTNGVPYDGNNLGLMKQYAIQVKSSYVSFTLVTTAYNITAPGIISSTIVNGQGEPIEGVVIGLITTLAAARLASGEALDPADIITTATTSSTGGFTLDPAPTGYFVIVQIQGPPGRAADTNFRLEIQVPTSDPTNPLLVTSGGGTISLSMATLASINATIFVPSGGNGGGIKPTTAGLTIAGITSGAMEKPTLNKEDHMAFIIGYPSGDIVGPEKNMTRGEVVTMFSKLIIGYDKNATYTPTFKDVSPDKWYARFVGFMEMSGVITGYTDGTFRPETFLTRAEFAAMAVKFDTLVTGKQKAFNDVTKGHWAYDPINFAADKGWINGYTDGSFHPDTFITREEVVTITCLMLDRQIHESSIENMEILAFKDNKKEAWSYYYMIEATNAHEYERKDGEEKWTSIQK